MIYVLFTAQMYTVRDLSQAHVIGCHAAASGAVIPLPADTHTFMYAFVAVMNMNRDHAQEPDYNRITALLNAVTHK